uniref:Thaumatin-like protein S3 n=1 Tax=Pinus monticola TaxID=3345 RepID=D3IZ13_PINMO|nr:thaumatin-like protein S3 [Pinus monticola]
MGATTIYHVTAIVALIFNVLYLQGAMGATFEIRNQCSYTVWVAGIPVGGGFALGQGQSWSVDVPAGTSAGRFWGRTGCSFDASGKGSCSTGDCGGVLSCTLSGQPPTTLVEYTLNGGNNNNQDSYDISVIDGFNVPLSLTPSDGGCYAPICTLDKCPDAYLYPGDTKTRTCSSGGNYYIVFCP